MRSLEALHNGNGSVSDAAAQEALMMSESLQAQWPAPEASLSEHHTALKQGIAVVENQMVLPDDSRYQVALSMLTSGRGQESSVSAKGTGGTGKTSFGDMVLGRHTRTDIQPKATAESLLGHRNVIKAGEWIDGDMKVDPENPVLFLNEVAHISNKAPLHHLYDSRFVRFDGEDVDMEAVAIYLTENFPDGERNHKGDEAWGSRQGIEILTGDHDDERAVRIQNGSRERRRQISESPLLAPAAARLAICSMVALRFPGADTGVYTRDLIKQLNQDGFVKEINKGDARIGNKMLNAARAHMFLKYGGTDNGKREVDATEYAEVAALALPTVTELSPIGREKLMDGIKATTGNRRRATKFEEALALRRIIASTAFRTLYDQQLHMTSDDAARNLDASMKKFSYVEPKAVSFDIDAALFGKSAEAAITENLEKQDEPRKRRFGRRG